MYELSAFSNYFVSAMKVLASTLWMLSKRDTDRRRRGNRSGHLSAPKRNDEEQNLRRSRETTAPDLDLAPMRGFIMRARRV